MQSLRQALTPYGNVDVRHGVPKGWVHITGDTRQINIVVRALKVSHAPALVGWEQAWREYRPILSGVVVSSRSAARVRHALALRYAPLLVRHYQSGDESIEWYTTCMLACIDRRYHTTTAKSLAKSLCKLQSPPSILADALQDAGYPGEDVLALLRQRLKAART